MNHSKLWKNFIGGDKKALANIFRSFYEELSFYGLKLTGSKDLAEDGLQDLFLNLWINRESLPLVENTRGYLYTSFRNVLYNKLKLYNQRNTVELDYENTFDIEFSQEDILIRKNINAAIREKLLHALNSLSPRQKEAIYLRYFDNMHFEDIAAIMGVNIQSVRNFIHKGLIKLRKLDFSDNLV